jgi:hypothetical protein
MTGRPAAGGGRWVTVAPERLARWLAGFAERHGPAEPSYAGDVVSGQVVVLRAADGAQAEVEVPFPPLVLSGDGAAPGPAGAVPAAPVPGALLRDALVRHALADRRVGVLLVRLGGYACGVYDGPRLVSSKVGSRQVHGRSAAGGQSQQRFARRREGQARVALEAAADTAFRVLAPAAATLDGLVVGGERTAVDGVLSDRRLAPLRPLVTGRLLDVPDPRQRVLESSYALLRQVWVRVQEPDPGS